MVAEYNSELYEPAHKLWTEMSAAGFKAAKNKTVWEERLKQSWHLIHFEGVGEGPADHVMSGSAVPLQATVDLAGLDPSEVRVEAVIGHIGANGDLQDTHPLNLVPVRSEGSAVVFANEFTVQQTGRLGYSVRISPNHFDMPLTRPCNALLKWISDKS